MPKWVHWEKSALNEISRSTRHLWLEKGKLPREALQYRYDGRYKYLYVDTSIIDTDFIDSMRGRARNKSKYEKLPPLTKEEIKKVIKVVGKPNAKAYYRMLIEISTGKKRPIIPLLGT